MKRYAVRFFAVVAAVLFLGVTVMEQSAHARAGGGRSFGSRGSRSYSRSVPPPFRPSQQRQQYNTPPPPPYQQQQSGGFLRGMAGGLVGGMLGSMLFRGTGHAGHGGMGGGIGFFEILLLAGIAYLIYRFIKKKRTDSPTGDYSQHEYQATTAPPPYSGSYQESQPAEQEVDSGLAHIRQMDPGFDENRFNDMVMDVFFRIQGAWMNRDLTSVSGLLTDEMRRVFQEDLDRLLRDRQINRLENIAVRNVEISEAWQESGQEYITTLIYANLLDYTTDDASGAVVSGSKTEPVKFEEYWTFTRPIGNNPWRLSAIAQK
jgi:predicted lipid-binding transport protein (Tim44 family)